MSRQASQKLARSFRTPAGFKRAFTLVELAATVSVILILAAIVVYRSGSVGNQARNAVLQKFLKDSRAIYFRLTYGPPPDYLAVTDAIRFGDYVGGTTLAGVQLQLQGTSALVITQLPATFFKDGRTTLRIDYQSNTYDGESEDTFLAKVTW